VAVPGDARRALSGLAILTQSLSNLDLLAERGETALVFLWITLLAMPQVIALLLPSPFSSPAPSA
jgi:lipopolysaccharide export system permease protein